MDIRYHLRLNRHGSAGKKTGQRAYRQTFALQQGLRLRTSGFFPMVDSGRAIFAIFSARKFM